METLHRSTASALQRPVGGRAAERGFTLVELLTVMGVMIIITSIVVANAFGVSKGAAYASAREIPFNVLQYAHQRACMDGKITAACFFEEGDEKNVSLIQVAGTVSKDATSGKVIDNYSDIAEMGAGDESEGRRLGGGMLRVFNFSNGSGFIAKSIARRSASGSFAFTKEGSGESTADGAKNKYTYSVTEIIAETDSKKVSGERWLFKPGEWQAGDQYGFEVSERIVLPKDFSYAAPGATRKKGEDFWIFFNPDGTSDSATINVVDIKGTSAAFTIRVDNGKVSLSDK